MSIDDKTKLDHIDIANPERFGALHYILNDISKHRWRAILTIIGIAVPIAFFILFAAMGEGSDLFIDSQTNALNEAKYLQISKIVVSWTEVLMVIIGIMIVISITNTMMLTLFERRKEIGTMMAIGLKSRHVIQLIIMESTIIGFVGSLMGILLSSVVIVILNRVGLSYQPPMSIDLVTIYPFFNPRFMLFSFFLGMLSSIAGAIYPARKILQVNPIDALRTL